MLKSFVKILFLFTFLFSCTPVTQNSLLSIGGEGSSTSGSENQTSISGTPSIDIDGISTSGGKVLVSGIENGDLLEVSGRCSDLGYKKNRILFQVFENPTGSGFPLIDNAIDWKCQANSATDVLASGNETCFVPSMGLGVVEDLQITPQYPQCFNGRFSFFVRLGRAMRQNPLSDDFNDATNPRVSYLLKAKLQLLGEGTQIMNSPLDEIAVNRIVSKPTAKLTLTGFTNKIELDVSKFSNKIKYNAFYSAAGASYVAGNSVSGSLFDSCSITTVSGTGAVLTSCSGIAANVISSTTNAGEFNHIGLVPGVTYAYQFEAEDFYYDYPTGVSGTTETSGYGLATGFIIPQTYIDTKSRITGPVRCTFTLASRSSASSVQWGYKVNDPGWMVSSPNVGVTVDATCSAYSDTCQVSGGGAGTQRHYAVRSFGDTDGDGVLDAGELVSDWSPPDYSSSTNVCDF